MLFGTDSNKKPYTVYLADANGALTPVMVHARNRHEADKEAEVFETDGVHVISVETCEDYYEQIQTGLHY